MRLVADQGVQALDPCLKVKVVLGDQLHSVLTGLLRRARSVCAALSAVCAVIHDEDVEWEVLRRFLQVIWRLLEHPYEFESLLRQLSVEDVLDADDFGVLLLKLLDVELEKV